MVNDPNAGDPLFVTFESGAQLLVERGLDSNANGDSVRYIARTRSDWPFGDPGSDKPHTYIKVANARTMETGVFLDYFRKHPPQPGVRGPDKKPRQARRQ
ncbi:hypothetical protein HY68_36450 [Streptomyces sp. AcH 505]|uniref:hypothetical protein n=1 Tax=Streptomyces sp. AcH 505 TaxID=352211 RepID=UPI000591F29C|nr:hypothetical protein HY68_36450 [Streptomyces sp. AcH 505]